MVGVQRLAAGRNQIPRRPPAIRNVVTEVMVASGCPTAFAGWTSESRLPGAGYNPHTVGIRRE